MPSNDVDVGGLDRGKSWQNARNTRAAMHVYVELVEGLYQSLALLIM